MMYQVTGQHLDQTNDAPRSISLFVPNSTCRLKANGSSGHEKLFELNAWDKRRAEQSRAKFVTPPENEVGGNWKQMFAGSGRRVGTRLWRRGGGEDSLAPCLHPSRRRDVWACCLDTVVPRPSAALLTLCVRPMCVKGLYFLAVLSGLAASGETLRDSNHFYRARAVCFIQLSMNQSDYIL